MNPPECFCKTWEHTFRHQRNGVTVVTKQCLTCGRSLGNVKKDQFDISKLPQFDDVRYDNWSREFNEWRAEEQRKFKTKESEWFLQYTKYLQSDHWQQLRRLVLSRDPICQRCFVNRSQQAHHVSYEGYKKYGFSFAVECAGMCTVCHDLIHGRDAL